MPYLRPIEVVQSQAGSASIVVDAEPASAVVTLERLSGAAVATLTATVDTYSATVATVTGDASLTSSSTDVVSAGSPLLHIPASGVASRAWVASFAAPSTITLEAPPMSILTVSDGLKGCRITATIPPSATSELGVNYRIRWVVTYADASIKSYDQRCYVVRSGFPPTPSITDTARFVVANYPSEFELQGGEKLRRVCFAAQDKVRNELMGRGRYAHLTGADSSTFSEAGLIALQSVLLMEGYFHADTDRVVYAESLSKRFFGAVMTGLRALQYYDANSDGVVSDSEKTTVGGTPAVRY